MNIAKHRLAVDGALAAGNLLTLDEGQAHYLAQVLRLTEGDGVLLFNRTDGEWSARITQRAKRSVVLQVERQTRPLETPTGLTVCFAPIKGGRLETIIEKATELGADVIQPVLMQRSVVDKVNLVRAEAIAREAAEQCERVSWPQIRPLLKLPQLLGSWPADVKLIYGDETGHGVPVVSLQQKARSGDGRREPERSERGGSVSDGGIAPNVPKAHADAWAILVGPEGGFAPEELAMLKKLPQALGVGLGPRILRADTAVIALCTATLLAWGDWDRAPRFTANQEG